MSLIFWNNIDTPLAFFTFLCATMVVFVNGWTDAPSTVFSVISSKTLKPWQALLLSAVFNFLGVLLCTTISGRVAENVFSLASSDSKTEGNIICLSCFLTVIIFGVAAWLFGMPSSESHALISSLSGASFAFGGFSLVFILDVAKIILYMVFSCFFAFTLSFVIFKYIHKKALPFRKLIIFDCALLSFMHGGQDGQKFIAIIMFLLCGSGAGNFKIPMALIVLVSLVMSISTLLGGKRIIVSLSKTIENCDTPSAFSSDFGSFFTLAICSILGMPVSTGNIKSISLFGVGIAQKAKTNKKIITEILLTSVITFPICFLLGFVLSKLLTFIL